jgi:ATP-dependent DNA helicase RecG
LLLGEGQSVEFKGEAEAWDGGAAGVRLSQFWRGYLVLGAGADGEPVGVSDDNDQNALHKLEQQVAQDLAPKALVSFEAQIVEGKTLWVIEVPAGKDIPYSFRDEAFIREGEMTRRADVATLRDMIMRRQVEPERWERRFSDADLDGDLDEGEIKRTAQRGERTHRSEAWVHDMSDPVQAIERLGLVKYGRLTNGGDMLFARNPARRHPQVRVRCAAFSTDKTDDTYRDFKNFEGRLFQCWMRCLRSFVAIRPAVAISADRSASARRSWRLPR